MDASIYTAPQDQSQLIHPTGMRDVLPTGLKNAFSRIPFPEISYSRLIESWAIVQAYQVDHIDGPACCP